MKKILCLVIVIMLLLSVACTEADVDESSATAEESTTDISKDTSEIVSSDTESSETESSVSQETSDESSEAYVFKAVDHTDGFVQCDHGAVYADDNGIIGFHSIASPFIGIHNDSDDIESGFARGAVPMTSEEIREWLNSETPDEYKFECNLNPEGKIYNEYKDIDPGPMKSKNVVMLLRQFDVDKEAFERDYYYSYKYYYGLYHDLDVLFDWDYQDACNWYLDYYNKYREILEAKSVLGTVKGVLENRYKIKAEDKNVSTAQLIYEKNIPRDEVEGLIEQYLTYCKSHNEKLHTGEVVISYKLDDVYNQSEEFMELLEKAENGEIYPVEVDEWFFEVQYNAE